MTSERRFKEIVHECLGVTPVYELLTSHDAVILERLAYGGGSTNWYYCRSHAQIHEIEGRLSPGSVVSFYFDGRIQSCEFSVLPHGSIRRMMEEHREMVVGVLGDDGIELKAAILDSREDLEEFESTLSPGCQAFYGVFPGRDNDGIQAVTVTLPDSDGVARGHPH
jgi:hypothetical protein